MIDDARDYYEQRAQRAQRGGHNKPELIVDKTRIMPFLSFYIASIAVVVSVLTFIIVITE